MPKFNRIWTIGAKNPMDAGCPSGSTSSRRFPGGLILCARQRTCDCVVKVHCPPGRGKD